jgi:hypothetical protein
LSCFSFPIHLSFTLSASRSGVQALSPVSVCVG